MQDETTGLTLELLYGVFAQQDVITRAARLTNHGAAPHRRNGLDIGAHSFPLQLPFHSVSAMEMQQIPSAKGQIQTGSYQMDVERSQIGLVRVVSGIQEERFAWNLKPGETFDTPEVILSFAAEGLTPLSQQYHRFLRRNICRGPWKDKRRPAH